ncbi:DNA binding domain [Trebouxia sp. C0009 RCD-2024]
MLAAKVPAAKTPCLAALPNSAVPANEPATAEASPDPYSTPLAGVEGPSMCDDLHMRDEVEQTPGAPLGGPAGYTRGTAPRIVVTDGDTYDDGYRWVKSGHGRVKGHAHPCTYYRCAGVRCHVRKRVEITGDDNNQLMTTYHGMHYHPKPVGGGNGDTCCSSRHSGPDGQPRGITSTRLQAAALAEAEKQHRESAKLADPAPRTNLPSEVSLAAPCSGPMPAMVTGPAALEAGAAAPGVRRLHGHHAPAGYRDAHRVHMPAAGARTPPLRSPPVPKMPHHPSSRDAQAQQAGGRSTSLPQPAASTLSLATPPIPLHPLVHDPEQKSTSPTSLAPLGPLHGVAPGPSSAAPPLTTDTSSIGSTMPESIMQVVDMVNNRMGLQQLRHHITKAQAIPLEEVFGDVEVLVDLVEMEDKPLNTLLRVDGKLNALQIVSMRGLLRSIKP